MEAKFTPGPWHAGRKTVTAPETEDRCALDARLYGGNPDNLRANARLIATTPDLFALAVAIDAHYSGSLDHQPGFVRMARAAIAKALGA